MYIYMYIYIYTYMYIYIYTYIHIYKYTYMQKTGRLRRILSTNLLVTYSYIYQ